RFDSLACKKQSRATFSRGRVREAEEMSMWNAARCRSIAADYARRALEARDPAVRRAFNRLEFLWRDMAPLAENVDRSIDPGAKERLYRMIDAAAEVRRKVA